MLNLKAFVDSVVYLFLKKFNAAVVVDLNISFQLYIKGITYVSWMLYACAYISLHQAPLLFYYTLHRRYS